MDLCGLCLRHRWQWLLKAADKLPANDTDSLCKILALRPLNASPALPAKSASFASWLAQATKFPDILAIAHRCTFTKLAK